MQRSMSNRQKLLRMAKGGESLASVQPMLGRRREVARQLAAGQLKQKEIAALTGYSPNWISTLKKDPEIQDKAEELAAERDKAMMSIPEQIEKGAKSGLQWMVDQLKGGSGASGDLMFKISRDLLDREGSAPRISKSQQQNKNLHLHLTGEDLSLLKQRARGRVKTSDTLEIPQRKDDKDLIPTDLLAEAVS